MCGECSSAHQPETVPPQLPAPVRNSAAAAAAAAAVEAALKRAPPSAVRAAPRVARWPAALRRGRRLEWGGVGGGVVAWVVRWVVAWVGGGVGGSCVRGQACRGGARRSRTAAHPAQSLAHDVLRAVAVVHVKVYDGDLG